MKVQVRFHGMQLSDALESEATRRAHAHLSRFGREVISLVVRLSDLNGPRGGVDKRCRMMARGPRIGTVTVSETHADPYAAVDLTLETLSTAIGRSIERAREPKLRPAHGQKRIA